MYKKIKIITLVNSKGMELQILNFGATLVSLKVPDKNNNLVNVVVSLKNTEDYLSDIHPCLGSSIGRYAGRISNGKFTIAEKEYPIYHENGVHLHGGKEGFDRKFWNVEEIAKGENTKVVLSIKSNHLEEGYPGNLQAKVTYELTENNEVNITYTATTDAETPVNLTNHAYYNLEGEGTISNHNLMINSSNHLEVSGQLLPSGRLISSKNTRFDRTEVSKIGRSDFIGYDDTFVLDNKALKAVLTSPKTGIKMEVYTNQPASVIYTPIELPKLSFKNKVKYSRYAAICFETQNFPDAPNKQHFPNSILQPKEEYLNKSVFKFSLI